MNGVRYQLMQAGGAHRNPNQRNGTVQYDHHSNIGEDFQACQNSKNCLIVLILVCLAFIMYLPFVPFASHRPIAFVWPANQSRDANILSRPYENTTKLAPSSVCNSSNNASNLVLLVVVCSAMNNFQERQAIRESWASDEIPGAAVIFLLGHVGNESSPLQVNVTHESDLYGDILQEDFIDSYANLTVKSLMLLKWFNKTCHKVPYVLKTDDDVYLNLANLVKLVSQNTKSSLLMGTLICGAAPIRDPYNKWFAPKYMYDKKRYPNYLSGTAYLMSRSVAATLYEAALQPTPVFHMEDIYITGILSQISGIRPQDHVGFSYIKRRATACLYAQTISSHHLSIEEMKEMHDKVRETKGKCAPIKKKFLRTYGPGRCLWTPPK